VPTLYDVSTVHIVVADANDNRPVFTHPSSTDNDSAVVQLTSSVAVGHVVIQVTATDADIGVNAQLSYSIVYDVSSEQLGLFRIDADSGVVTVAAPLRSVTYDLLIAVSDAGTPRLTSHATLHVVVTQTGSPAVDVISSRRSALSSASGVAGVPWWLIAGGCLMAAGLVVVFTTFCLFVSAKRKRQPHNDATTSTVTPPATSLSRRKTQAPPPLALMTDMDPLTSAMLRRHQFDDVTVLEQPPGEYGNYVTYMQNTAICKSAPVST